MPFALGASLIAVLGLHFLSPALSITWSYAHLARDPWRVIAAAVLVSTLPALGAWGWQRPLGMRPLAPWSGRALAVAGVVTIATFALLGGFAPAPASNYDSIVLLDAIRGARDAPMRWMLGAATLETLYGLLAAGAGTTRFVASVNSALAAIGLLGLFVAGREVTRTRGEAVALGALVVSAFGTAQIAIGYVEVYPVALGVLGAYIGLAARSVQRDSSLVACAVIAGIAPFCYVGLALLAPSAVVLAIIVGRRPGGLRRVALAAGAGLAVAGLATVPEYGVPFAWTTFLADVAADSHAQIGLQQGSPLLPLRYIVSAEHLNEVVHSLLLVDPVGWLLLLGPGVALAVRRGLRAASPFAVFLGAIVLPYLLYSFSMDPLFGAYLDWDLWVTGAPAVSLLGGWAFLVWGREHPRSTGALLGLALACAGVHALARLHAMPFDAERHLRESPSHISRQDDRSQAIRRPNPLKDA